MANYDIAMAQGSRKNYEKDLILKQDNAEWLGFIYYVEGPSDKLHVPFDIVLIGRPFWLRAKHLAVMTTDGYSSSQITGVEQIEWERSYAAFWRKNLRIRENPKGWPVNLYRLLLALRGITPDT